MILYQVWVPAVVFAHVLGFLWLAWSLNRLFGPALRKAGRKLLAKADFRLLARQTRQTRPAPACIDLEVRPGSLPVALSVSGYCWLDPANTSEPAQHA